METKTNEMSSLCQMFELRMQEFNDKLLKASTTTTASPKLETLAAEFESFRSFILAAVSSLQQQTKVLSRAIDNLETRSRRNMLLFHGVTPNNDKVTPATAAVEVMSKHMKLSNISTDIIKRAHWLGRDAAKPRVLVVKFKETAMREAAWTAKTRLKGSGVTLSEFLTKQRHEAFLAARERFGIQKCWTRNGLIFVLTPDGKLNKAECIEDIRGIDDLATSDTGSGEGTKQPEKKIARTRKAPKK